jgi:repressor LexA
MDALTPIQRQLLSALRRRAGGGELPPTYRELCEEFGWRSTGTVRDHLRALARKGFLELTGKHRNLRLQEEQPKVTLVPLLGRVVAGMPVISDENVEESVAVPAAWAGRGPLFALRVAGDSMGDAGILEGDQVIVRQDSAANDGDIVVATIEGETTIKRLRLTKNHATLVAENPMYRPIEVRVEDVVVQGVVVGLMRLYRGGSAVIAASVDRRLAGQILSEGGST